MTEQETDSQNNLAQRKSGSLSNRASLLTVGMLERKLLEKFPASDAESWDRTGLLVGDPAASVKAVAVALDPTVRAIEEARAVGADVLLTHHPVYLTPPSHFAPQRTHPAGAGAAVWAAIENQVALMSFHTALDVSVEARSVLPGMLRLRFERVLVPLESSSEKGFGQVCSVAPDDAPLTLGQLASRCTAVFGRQPRVWGDFDRRLKTVVTSGGSAGDFTHACMSVGADVLVCGELKYHDALAASEAGLAIIDIGHDTSELPLATVLGASAEAVGIPKDKITIIDQGSNWSSPETTRV